MNSTSTISVPIENRIYVAGKNLQCTEKGCDTLFYFHEDFTNHMSMEHNNKIPYECNECHQKYVGIMELLNHVQFDHPGNEQNHMKRIDAKKGNYFDRSIDCDFCDGKYANKYTLKAHVKKMHKNADLSLLKCNQCDKTCYSKRLLSEHQRRKHGPFVCGQCTKEFKTKGSLRWHQKQVHTTELRLKCTQCKSVLKTRAALKFHCRRVHDMERNYECNVPDCGKTFFTRTSLTAHSRTHTGIKPFVCNLCQKAFSQKSNLQVHQKTVHVTKRMYHCDESDCNKSFKTALALRLHYANIHEKSSMYPCDLCNKSFGTSKALSQHVRRVHDKEINYRCHQCGKGFFQKGQYKYHLTIHSGDRLFACNVCDKNYRGKGDLNNHKRRKHS